MSLNISINILPLVVATIVNFFLGFIWYGPLFGKEWMKAVKMSKKDIENAKKADMKLPLIIVILTNLITAFVIGVLISSLGYASLSSALLVGIFIWSGFYFTKNVSQLLWEKKSINLLYINASYELIMVLITIIIFYIF